MVHEDIDALTLVGELYAPAGCSERFHVRYRVVDDLERVLQDRSENIPCEGYKTLMVLPIDSEKLAFGDFRVEVTLSAPGERGRITRELWFAADETLVPIRTNFGRALEIAEVIGTDEELDELRNARGEEREALWDEFWTKRDPDPNTERNEFKDDFFDRLRYANRNFATAVTAGWKTDRGYTLLKFGHPDRIERQSFSVDRPVREVWIYVDSGRRFVFEDDGLGSFRLAGTS